MKKITLSVMTLLVVASLVGMATYAYFSDTETSTNNYFTAGRVNLRISNDGYYNGVLQDGSVGTVDTTWTRDNLTDQLFFQFDDVKPGDWGENTTDIHVTDNPFYACANITLTAADENGIIEPEASEGDVSAAAWEGELQNEMRFLAWADDGDNIYELGEHLLLDDVPFSSLPMGLGNTGVTLTLADASTNVWTGTPGDDLNPLTEYYIGHGWCFGDMTVTGTGATGYTCDGASVDNLSQTDGLIGNISFYAIQSRNNAAFDCDTWTP